MMARCGGDGWVEASDRNFVNQEVRVAKVNECITVTVNSAAGPTGMSNFNSSLKAIIMQYLIFFNDSFTN